MTYYSMQQLQDAKLGSSTLVDIPYYFMDAFVFGLALRLAMIWAPDRVAMLTGPAEESWQIASARNIEPTMVYISPMLTSYWRT
jgi:hypothetical protein